MKCGASRELICPAIPLALFIALLFLGLHSCSSQTNYLNPAEERYGAIDLVMCDPYRQHWEQQRAEGQEACRRALNDLDVPVLDYRFESPDHLGGWKNYGGLEQPRIGDGVLKTRVRGSRASLACRVDPFPTEQASQLLLELSVEGGEKAVFLWRPVEQNHYSGKQSKEFSLVADGRFHVYRVPLQKGLLPLLHSADWSGTVNALRLDFPEEAGEVAIRRIELVKAPGRDQLLAERVRHGVDDRVTLQQVSQPVLPAGTVVRNVMIPENGVLLVDLGVMRAGWPRALSKKRFHFRLGFRSHDGARRAPLTLHSHFLSPQNNPSHRGWVPLRLPLDQLAGEAGELIFETGVDSGQGTDWGVSWPGTVWGSPRLGIEGGIPSRTDVGKPANLILISLDTLRADRMSCYGHFRLTTPQIDKRLVDQGAQIVAARSSAPWTLPAHASLMTGLDTLRRSFDSPGPLPRDCITLAEIMRDAGYVTAAVTGGGNLGPEWGFDRGFQVYTVETKLTRAVDDALDLLPHFNDAPYFLFFHTYETHAGYTPREPYISSYEPRPYSGQLEGQMAELLRINREGLSISDEDRRHLQALYDSEIAYTDFHIGRMLSSLQGMGLLENTLVILLSDHGEEFGDHGGVEHGRSLYDELLHIPMIFHQPGTVTPGALAGTPAAMVDVLPTVVDLLGLEQPAGLSGRSLAALLTGRPGAEAVSAPLFAASVTNPLYGDRKYALSDGRTKVILHPESGREEILDLNIDPGELGILPEQTAAADGAAMLKRLRERLGQEGLTGKAEHESGDPLLSEETLSRLRQLGYLE